MEIKSDLEKFLVFENIDDFSYPIACCDSIEYTDEIIKQRIDYLNNIKPTMSEELWDEMTADFTSYPKIIEAIPSLIEKYPSVTKEDIMGMINYEHDSHKCERVYYHTEPVPYIAK